MIGGSHTNPPLARPGRSPALLRTPMSDVEARGVSGGRAGQLPGRAQERGAGDRGALATQLARPLLPPPPMGRKARGTAAHLWKRDRG